MNDFIALKEKIRQQIKEETWIFCKVLETEHDPEAIASSSKFQLSRYATLLGKLIEDE